MCNILANSQHFAIINHVARGDGSFCHEPVTKRTVPSVTL